MLKECPWINVQERLPPPAARKCQKLHSVSVINDPIVLLSNAHTHPGLCQGLVISNAVNGIAVLASSERETLVPAAWLNSVCGTASAHIRPPSALCGPQHANRVLVSIYPRNNTVQSPFSLLATGTVLSIHWVRVLIWLHFRDSLANSLVCKNYFVHLTFSWSMVWETLLAGGSCDSAPDLKNIPLTNINVRIWARNSSVLC